MSLRTAVTIGLIGAAFSLVLQLGFLVGGDSYVRFMYSGDIAIGWILGLLPPLTLLIFFVVLRIKQK